MWKKYEHIIPHIYVGSGVIARVPDWAVAEGYKTVLVVYDPNTYFVAGERVVKSLKAAGITVLKCRFAHDEPVPNEESIGMVTTALTPQVELILGVGSGTINDICTYVGEKVGKPSAIVGTAASMDGYASLGSAMLLGGLKVTPQTQCPTAIFCDTDILCAAPDFLTAAGLGDMLGKITALADWRLSHLIVDEPMPDDIVSIVEQALKKIIDGVPLIAQRDPAVIGSITEGLILSGIAMSLYKDSRPASGTEHHISHFWEMRMHALGKVPALHGAKVGLATIIGLIMWKELINFDFDSIDINDFEHYNKRTPEYESNIKRLYEQSAKSILETENPCIPLEHIKENWSKILDIAKALPSPEEVASMLDTAGAPTRPTDINLSDDMLRESIIYARDRKKTYSLLQLLGGLGLLENYANHVKQYFAKTALAGVKCFVVDMDGTIYLGDKLFPFTNSFLDHLKKIGMDYVFYTNNSSQNASNYLKKLERMNIPVTPDKLLMSTHVLLSYLTRSDGTMGVYKINGTVGNRVFIAGTKALMDDFTAAGFIVTEDSPDFTVLGFDTDMDYARLTKLCDFVRSGLPYFGVNMDYNCPVDGGYIPDCGALAAAVEISTGMKPEFFGKPSTRTLDYIIEKTGYSEEQLCFIGDRLYTDIATAFGKKARSVLVLSGETNLEDLHNSEFTPDIVVGDLSGLLEYL